MSEPLAERSRRWPRSERLTGSSNYRRIYDTGTSHRTAAVVLVVARSIDDRTRYGFVASRKVGSAVVRNRARRLMREAVRTSRPIMRPDRTPQEMIFIARRAIVDRDADAVRADVRRLLAMAGEIDVPR